ncbi:hypothetical protein [Halomarina litorea]|uniref:hypothetical protein n=1 Tax=Halomarina litorea TaxID=2961595 RepID=UPI0020C37EF2|nr:hypothetical protein [Halomarina sp. BCD28]
MSTLHHAPGPDADAAFRLGLAVATTGALAALALSVWAGSVTLLGATLFALFGLPVLLVVVASVLSVWLGYDKRAVDVTVASRTYTEK